MIKPLLRWSLLAVVVGVAITLRPAGPASAVVHLAEIHEIMVGANGDPDVQYIEINMRLVILSVGGMHICASDTHSHGQTCNAEKQNKQLGRFSPSHNFISFIIVCIGNRY